MDGRREPVERAAVVHDGDDARRAGDVAAGAPAGPITVNGTVSDDRGLTASCSSSVNVEVPPPPPTASKLNEINFPDKKKPARVDNAAKAILDDVALKLQRDADAKAVVIGFADAEELKKKTNKDLAAERAYHTKQYLATERVLTPPASKFVRAPGMVRRPRFG